MTFRWHVKSLAADSSDSSHSFLAVADSGASYLFGCGENTSRLFIQQKQAFKRVKAIFLQDLTCEHASGLFGFLLSLKEAGVSAIDIYGPPNLNHFLATGRYYTRRDSFTVRTHEISATDTETAIYTDKQFKVYALPLSNGETLNGKQAITAQRKRKRSNSPSNDPSKYSGEDASKWISSIVQDMFRTTPVPFQVGIRTPAWHPSRLPKLVKSEISSVAFLVVGPVLPGRFLVDKARGHGVKPGPDFAKLKSGEDVKVGDTIIRSSDCVEAHESASAFCSLVSSEEKADATSNLATAINNILLTEQATLKYAFHRTPLSRVNTPQYQTLIGTLGSETQHYISNQQLCTDEINFASAALHQMRLALLDDVIYKVSISETPSPDISIDPKLQPWTSRLTLRGTKGQHQTISESTDTRNLERSISKLKAVTTSPHDADVQAKARTIWQSYLVQVENAKKHADFPVEIPPERDFSVTALGTGSATPSNGTLVHHTASGLAILLDCGEGILGQLRRRYGFAGADGILRSLTVIFASHNHADHHSGLSSLLHARSKLVEKNELTIVCTNQINTYLQERHEFHNLGLNEGIQFENSHDLLNTPIELQYKASTFKLHTVPVIHRARCYGLVVEENQGWKLIYSGDTRPCDALVEAGQDADLLVHEATLEDGMQDLAVTKGHSTYGEALDIAKRMNVKYCLMSHISQRYPKQPKSVEREGGPIVANAVDLMTLRASDFHKLWRYEEAITTLCQEIVSEATTALRKDKMSLR